MKTVSSTYKKIIIMMTMTAVVVLLVTMVPGVVSVVIPRAVSETVPDPGLIEMSAISGTVSAAVPDEVDDLDEMQKTVTGELPEDLLEGLSEGLLKELSLREAVALLKVADRDYKIARLELENQQLNYEMNQARTLRTESRYDRLTGELSYLQAQNEFRQTARSVFIGLIDSYQELNFLAQEISIAERNKDMIADELEETWLQVEAGYSSRMDLMLKQREYNQAAFELARLEAELEQKEREFKSRLGLVEMPELTSQLGQIDKIDLPEREIVVQEVLASSSGLEVVEINRELIEIERDRARVSDTPELEMARLDNQVELAGLEIEKAREDTEGHALQQYHLVEQAFRQLELAQDNIEQTEENHRIIQEQRRAGLASERELAQAELEFEQAELNRAEAGLAYLMSYYDLRDLMGEELEVLVDEILAQGEI